MKTLRTSGKILMSLLIIFAASSCESDNVSNHQTESITLLTGYSKVTYGQSGIKNDSTYYQLNQGKPQSFETYDDNNLLTATGQYTYSNGLLSSIRVFSDQALTYQKDYAYDTQNRVTMIIEESVNSTSNRFVRSEFNYSSPDTIVKTNATSLDGVSYDALPSTRIVLDNDGRRLYDITGGADNNSAHTYTYSRDNIIEIEHVDKHVGQSDTALEVKAIYGTTKNTLHEILANRIGYQNLMVSMDGMNVNSLNDFTEGLLSKSVPETSEIVGGFENSDLIRSSVMHANGYAEEIDVQTLISGQPFSRTIYHFDFNDQTP